MLIWKGPRDPPPRFGEVVGQVGCCFFCIEFVARNLSVTRKHKKLVFLETQSNLSGDADYPRVELFQKITKITFFLTFSKLFHREIARTHVFYFW